MHSNAFQSTRFHNWKNAKSEKHGALPAHEASEAHRIAATKALAFLEIEAGRAKDIQCSLSKAHEDEIKKTGPFYCLLLMLLSFSGSEIFPYVAMDGTN